MLCKVYSPWTDFVSSFPSVLFFSNEVFGAFSAEKGEKYHIMECYLVWKTANRLLFRRQEKVKMMDVLIFLVLSHFHIGSMLLPLNQSCPLFAQRCFMWQCYKKLHIDQFWIFKGLNQSNKIGMLHKIKGKSLISLRSLSPSPIVLHCCFIQDFSPTPLPPLYFILIEIHT